MLAQDSQNKSCDRGVLLKARFGLLSKSCGFESEISEVSTRTKELSKLDVYGMHRAYQLRSNSHEFPPAAKKAQWMYSRLRSHQRPATAHLHRYAGMQAASPICAQMGRW